MKHHSVNSFYLVLFTIGFIWLKSGYGKIAGGKFVDGLSATLTKFATTTPYRWYSEFLTVNIIPNSNMFGQLIQWGEIISALFIMGSVVYLLLKKRVVFAEIILLIGVVVGAALNLNFWLAAGSSSPSTDSLNFLMFVIQFIAVVVLLRGLKKGEAHETKR